MMVLMRDTPERLTSCRGSTEGEGERSQGPIVFTWGMPPGNQGASYKEPLLKCFFTFRFLQEVQLVRPGTLWATHHLNVNSPDQASGPPCAVTALFPKGIPLQISRLLPYFPSGWISHLGVSHSNLLIKSCLALSLSSLITSSPRICV